MTLGGLKSLRSLALKTGVGIYEFQGKCYRARAGLTPLGVVELPEQATAQEEKIKEAREKAQSRFRSIAHALLRRIGKAPRRAPAAVAAKKPRTKLAVVGLKPDAVTFISEPVSADAAARAATARDNERVDKAPSAILHDSISLSVGNKTFLATARVRREQLDAASATSGCAVEDGHHFEPAPWALWRASLHHAPLKPKRAVHLRFIVGDGGGLVVLAGNERPLAWQLLARESEKEWFDALLHAFHVLDLFAARRLGVGAVAHLSVQGAQENDRAWEALSNSIHRPISRVAGPGFGPDAVAFGAALGALDPAKETLNLARNVQDPPRLLSLVPWGEVALILVLFVGMFVSLRYYLSDTRQQLATLSERAVAAAWANGMTDAQLKQEMQKFEKEVAPLRTFLSRDLYFSRALDALSESLPSPTWLANFSGADLIWEKSPNKALGQRYILISAGAPSESEGAAPPEIHEAVQAMAGDEYLGKVLANVKLTDVNWHREAGKSFALFSVLAMPKQK